MYQEGTRTSAAYNSVMYTYKFTNVQQNALSFPFKQLLGGGCARTHWCSVHQSVFKNYSSQIYVPIFSLFYYYSLASHRDLSFIPPLLNYLVNTVALVHVYIMFYSKTYTILFKIYNFRKHHRTVLFQLLIFNRESVSYKLSFSVDPSKLVCHCLCYAILCSTIIMSSVNMNNNTFPVKIFAVLHIATIANYFSFKRITRARQVPYPYQRHQQE